MQSFIRFSFVLLCVSFAGAPLANNSIVDDKNIITTSPSSTAEGETVHNWYLASPTKDTEAAGSVYGGYQRQLIANFDLFVEAGVVQDHDEMATQRGYDMATGVNYYPKEGWMLGSRVSRIKAFSETDSKYDLEFSSSYLILEKVSIKASYQLKDYQTDNSSLEQTLKIGLGYRF